MGLLDSLFSASQGGGLLNGLPASWQYQNPDDEKSKNDLLTAALSGGVGNKAKDSQLQASTGVAPYRVLAVTGIAQPRPTDIQQFIFGFILDSPTLGVLDVNRIQ